LNLDSPGLYAKCIENWSSIHFGLHAGIEVNGSDKLWKNTGWMHGENRKISQYRFLFLDSRYFSVFINIVSVSVFLIGLFAITMSVSVIRWNLPTKLVLLPYTSSEVEST